ncbi:aldo/keto reductase [Actinoallomurus vinaceus]|uniref:Aldo/keto reductase n=1 Tax=Actinoallomurus vinaceus TaxID=1080074 RepID=A0ABP8UUH8_9ACTN
MDYAHLGRSGLSVSRLCLGTLNFGRLISEENARALMDRAHECGINLFDTANVYGHPRGEGVGEAMIGRWFALGGGRRDRTVLATKLYSPTGSWPNEGHLSALNIRRACDASLKRLRTDYIDIYQMHHVDRETPFEEIWEAFDVLRRQGKILYVGSSNFAGWHIAKAQEMARRRETFGLVSEQSIYNLLRRTVELEVLPACQDYGVGVLAWSPLGAGLLGGVLRKQDKGYSASVEIGEHRARISEFEAFCDESGDHPARIALAWLLRQPAVTAPIVGPRNVEQLDEAVRSLETKIDREMLARLDEIFPGPGGAAPEAYSW